MLSVLVLEGVRLLIITIKSILKSSLKQEKEMVTGMKTEMKISSEVIDYGEK